MIRKQRTKENGIHLILVGFIGLLLLIAGEAARLAAPLFDMFGYGALRPFFYELIRALIWLVGTVALCFFVKRNLGFCLYYNPEEKGNELSVKASLRMALFILGPILFISYQIGWQVKPFYDLGEKFSGYELVASLALYMGNFIRLFLAVIMMRSVEEAMERLLPQQKKVIWGGLFLTVTFGLYEFVTGQHKLSILYLLLNLLFGVIYRTTNKSVLKTYFAMLAIYFF